MDLFITEEEKESLTRYVGWKQFNDKNDYNILNRCLNYQNINSFLRYLETGSFDENFIDIHIKEMVQTIKNLISLSCKYGATHQIDNCLYRVDESRNIQEIYKEKSLITLSSFSLSNSEINNFAFLKQEPEIMMVQSNSGFIPHIDVNNILKTDSVGFFEDEKEILLSPYLKVVFQNSNEFSAYDEFEYQSLKSRINDALGKNLKIHLIKGFEIATPPQIDLPKDISMFLDDFIKEYRSCKNQNQESDNLKQYRLQLSGMFKTYLHSLYYESLLKSLNEMLKTK